MSIMDFPDQQDMKILIAQLQFKLVFIRGTISQIAVMRTLPALRSLYEAELTEEAPGFRRYSSFCQCFQEKVGESLH